MTTRTPVVPNGQQANYLVRQKYSSRDVQYRKIDLLAP